MTICPDLPVVTVALVSLILFPVSGIASDDNCLEALPSKVVSEQFLPGGNSRITAKIRPRAGKALAIQSVRQRLRRLARPGHLMRKSVGRWEVFSFWLHQSLCIAQLRLVGQSVAEGFISRLHLTTTVASSEFSRAARQQSDPPKWWPQLQRLHIDSWRDGVARVRSIIGYSNASEASLRDSFINRATRAGYGLLGSKATSRQSSAPGSVLTFGQANRELMVVLIPQGLRTGVVAHLREDVR